MAAKSVTFLGKTYTDNKLFFTVFGQYCGTPDVPNTQQAINDIISIGWAIPAKMKLKLMSNGYKVDYSLLPKGSTAPKNENPVNNSKRAFDAHVANKYSKKYENAVARNIEFDLSFTDFKTLLRTKHCFYTGINLTLEVGPGGVIPANYLTIERIDASKGYVKGNCAAVSNIANMWKAEVLENPNTKIPKLSIDEMIQLLQTVKGHG